MSIFESLFTAVSGMNAQSQSLSMISNNIANVSTVGYKRTDAAFSSLVVNQGRNTVYSPGSIGVRQNARINQQGILQQSASATDFAISGTGFFVVKASTTDPLAETLYTRAGSFSENSSGILTNTAGFALYGWPLGQDGSLPAASADISSLVPVNVAFLGGLTQPTTTVSLDANLSATEDPYTVGVPAIPTFPVPLTSASDFTRDITVYDSLGASHGLSVVFQKEESPTAIARGTLNLGAIEGPLAGQLGIAAGNSFRVTIPSAVPAATVVSITAATTLADVQASINAISDANGNPVAFAQLDNNNCLVIKARNLADTVTLANVAGTPLTGLGIPGAQIGVALNAPAGGGAATPQLTTMSSTPNTEGWWQVSFRTPDGATVASGSINFTGNGLLNGTLDANGETLVDLNNIDWLNGSTQQDINFNIAGFTQFSGEYNVVSSQQNGAALGLRTGLSVDKDGVITAQFSNGQSQAIYQIPIATFANPNGMNEATGNVFRQTTESGDFNLREAGNGSAGSVQGGTLEASNVDLADEFSKMIVTQRAYSADTKVLQTADQMTQELLQLR